MVQRVQTLRSTVKGQRPAPGSREAGEVYVSFPDLALGVIDIGKNPVDLLPVRFFSASADYSIGHYVVQSGLLYRAKSAVTAGAFNPTQWDQIAVTADLTGKENTITPGNTSQYWRGDKTWVTLDKSAVGLSNVDNTSDVNKPVSTAQGAADGLRVLKGGDTMTGHLALPTGPAAANAVRKDYVDGAVGAAITGLAPLASPAFTGNPTAPTPTAGDSDTSIATTAFVANAVAAIPGLAPIASPVFTGDPRAPTPATADNDTSIATTAYVKAVVAAIPGATPGGIDTYVQFNDSMVFGGDAGLTFNKTTDILTAVGGFSTSGTVTATGSITSGGAMTAVNYFISSTATALLASNGNGGACYLYPNGTGITTGRVYVTTGGDWFVSDGYVYANGFQAVGSGANGYLAGGGGSASIILRPAGVTNTTNQGIYSSAGNLTIAGPTGTKSTGTAWANPSDARIKEIVGDYEPGLDAILALTPRRFTYRGNETPGEPGTDWTNPEAPKDDSAEAHTVPYPSSPHYTMALDGTVVAGLVAQEVEDAMPDLVTRNPAYIDGEPVDDFRILDASNVTYALINAVKELAAKVATLEAALAAKETSP